jgi:hypothetical protein
MNIPATNLSAVYQPAAPSAAQSPAAFPSSPVERLSVSSGMDSQAISDLLAPSDRASSTQAPVATFNAQAQLVQPLESTTGSNIDITA